MSHPDDTPDRLSPAKREQYERYAQGKIGRGEIPRTPMGWDRASAELRAQWLYGKAVQMGVGVVFGLEKMGARPEVTIDVGGGKKIRADWRVPNKGVVVALNIETKGGKFDTKRDIAQLKGYEVLMQRGEQVTLFTRASKEQEISKEARELIERFARDYPQNFTIMRANEKVFHRVFEAGMKVVQKDLKQRLEQNIAKLPEREVPVMAVEQIARDYLRDIHDGAKQGRPVEIEQLRLMNQILRDMAQAQFRIDRDKADEHRKALGLRYHESRDVEKFLQQQAKDKEVDRATAIDKVTHELLDRERAELAKATAEVAKRLQMDRAMARPLDLEKLKQANLALGNTFGAIQKMETELFKDMAKDLPQQDAANWLRGMELIQAERDEKTRQEIDKLAETARKEEKARAERDAAEKERRTLDQQRAAALERVARDGVPEEIVKLLALGQAQPPSVAVERGPDGAPRVERGGRDAIDRARGLGRER